MIDKQATIESIKERILSEYKKHYQKDSDDWAHIAAIKIHSTHIDSKPIDEIPLKVVSFDEDELLNYLKNIGCE